MIVIPLIPIMALVIQNIIILRDVIERKENLLVADRSVLKSDETARLIAALQRERTASLMQVSVATKRNLVLEKMSSTSTEYQINLVS